MATYTTHLGLKKPAGDENMNVADLNGNADDIDAAIIADRAGMAIVSKGNTHSAINSGEYVYVYDHSTLTDGLYVASSSIAANATLSTSNLTALTKGIGNDLMSKKVNTTDRVVIDRNRNASLGDCNSVSDPGMYRIINTTQNKPNSMSYGILYHMVSNDYIAQMAINTAGSVLAIRGKSGGSWNAWKVATLTTETT